MPEDLPWTVTRKLDDRFILSHHLCDIFGDGENGSVNTGGHVKDLAPHFP